MFDRALQVDALRGVAAFLVLLLHAAMLPYTGSDLPKLFSSTLSFLDPGRVGVVLFFIISGFVIPSSLSGPRLSGVRTFVFRRFFRLYPLFWLSMLIAMLPIGMNALPIEQFRIGANATMFPGLLGSYPLIGVYWTLEVEMFFYLICIVLFLVGCIRKPIVFLGLLIIAAAVQFMFFKMAGAIAISQLRGIEPQTYLFKAAIWLFGDGTTVPVGSTTNFFMGLHFASMMFGALLRFYYDNTIASRFARRTFILMTLGVVSFFMIYPVVKWYGGRLPWPVCQTSLSYAVPVALSLLALTPKFACPPLVSLGRWSYSLYLIHAPIVYFVYTWAKSADAPALLKEPVVQFSLSLSLSIGFAFVLFHVVERPMMRLGRRVTSARASGFSVRQGPNRWTGLLKNWRSRQDSNLQPAE